jgi:hypothetical protein
MGRNYWLVDALVERLAPIVAEHVHVSASGSGDNVDIGAGGLVDMPNVRAIAERGDEEGLASAAMNVLNELQVMVENLLEMPWPAPGSAAGARLDGSSIVAGYYDGGGEAVLELDPIELPETGQASES